MSKKIDELIGTGLIEKTKGDYIKEKFEDFTQAIEEWSEKANAIVVTDEAQKELMAEAREGRLLLKAKRIEVEKTRKMLKEQSLSEGRLIDSVAKYLTSLIEPTEKHLELQEKFIEIQEQNKRIKLKAERTELLQPYKDVIDPNSIQLDLITDEAFTTILNGAKFSLENKKAEALRLENEIKEKERKNVIFHQRTLQVAEYKNFINNDVDLILTTETEEFYFNEYLSILKHRKEGFDNAQEELRKQEERQKELLRKENERLKKQNEKKKEEIKNLKKEVQQTPTKIGLNSISNDLIQEKDIEKKESKADEENIMVSRLEYEALQNKYKISKFVLDSVLAYIVPQNLRDLANKGLKEISEIDRNLK